MTPFTAGSQFFQVGEADNMHTEGEQKYCISHILKNIKVHSPSFAPLIFFQLVSCCKFTFIDVAYVCVCACVFPIIFLLLHLNGRCHRREICTQLFWPYRCLPSVRLSAPQRLSPPISLSFSQCSLSILLLHYACYLSPLLKSNVDFLWIPVHTCAYLRYEWKFLWIPHSCACISGFWVSYWLFNSVIVRSMIGTHLLERHVARLQQML